MKLSGFVAFSVLLCSVLFPAMAEIKISPLSLKDSGVQDDYHFPIVSGTNEAENLIAKNMNILMQLSELGVYSPSNDATQLFLQNESLPFSISYAVIYQNSQLVTLQFFKQYRYVMNDDESEHINNIESYYVFDLSTGRLVAPSMLFTPTGLSWLNEQLMEQRGAEYDHVLGKLQALLKDKNISAEEVQKQIDEVKESKLWSVEEAGSTVGLASYPPELRVMSDSLAMVRGYSDFLDNFSIEDTDELEQKYNEFSYEQLTSYLSRYGQCLLLQNQQDCQPEYKVHVVPGVWSGQLDNEPIMFVITGYDPYYMDGMGHDLHGYLFLNQDKPLQVSAHGELVSRRPVFADELLPSGIPIFRGVLTDIEGNATQFQLTFLHDGRWISVNETVLELLPGT